MSVQRRPNILFVFADQWRAQAAGYAENGDVHTPNLDALARRSINFPLAVSGCPVCSPARASYLTGRHPLTHGVFVNDVYLQPDPNSLAHCFQRAGYQTAYIGKWHLDGHGCRSGYIPRERRQGFESFKALECTHDYRHSCYYADDDETPRLWEGHDAFAQTHEACRFIRRRAREDAPWLLVLSWGPPHGPLPPQHAPEPYRQLYDPSAFTLRPNVPPECRDKIRDWLHNYYAYCTALDECIGRLRSALEETDQDRDTILLFTSDHGDMLGSHGQYDKQRPWDESIRVPFLLHWPMGLGEQARSLGALIDCPDVMPTLLGLAGLKIPDSVQGKDFSAYVRGQDEDPSGGAALIQCPHPFGNYNRVDHGGREFRGLRTRRYIYVRDLNGPWLLYDNETDPYQLANRADDSALADVRAELDVRLDRLLEERGDEFLPGTEYVERWGYEIDEKGTVPYTW